MSQTASIPFSAGQGSSLDELSGASPRLRNFLIDAADALHVRPGIGTWSDFPTVIPNASPVIGIYPWRQYVIYVCEDRTLWAWVASGLVQPLSNTTAATKLDGTGRPVFTYDALRVAVTGGGAPQQWQGVGLSARLAPAAIAPDGSGLTLTHIAYAGSSFIGNVNSSSGYLVWTPTLPGNHTSWPVVGPYYAEAEVAPDRIIAVYASGDEVFTFGTETTQVYIPDSQVGFAVTAAIQIGSSAAFSVIAAKDGIFEWLDDSRRFVSSNGRGFDVVSSPAMTGTIKALGTVSDCWGANMMIGPWDLLVWSFPTEERCFWRDKDSGKWGEFSTADANGEPGAWVPTSYAYLPATNTHLIGLASGKIGVLTAEAATDDGATIIADAITGFQDRGSFVHKTCDRVQIQVRRRAPVLTGTDPVFEYRYRDTLGAWKTRRRRSLAAPSLQPVVDLGWSLGQYRQRQHWLSFSGGSGFTMTGATETYTVEEEAS
jgi:hypothetical protein